MFPFAYTRASSVDKASRLVATLPEAKVMAGGMSLIPAMKLRLTAINNLVDLAAIPGLASIAVEGQRLRIGAMTRHYEVAASPAVREALPALSSLAAGIGDVQVRYRGTIGGSVANADPAADYPAAVLGLGASVITNMRTVSADEFFLGLFQTALRKGEIITAFDLPLPKQAVYLKFANQASRFAIVGLFLARFPEGVRLAVTGASSHALRISTFEAALSKRFSPSSLEGLEIAHDDFATDVHAPAAYRAHLIRVLARRAVEICHG